MGRKLYRIVRSDMSFEDDMLIMSGVGSGKTTINNKFNVNKYKKENKGKDLEREWTYQEIWDEVLYSGNILPKTLTDKHRVVFVDADGVVYRTSAAVETRSVKTVVEGIEVEFPTRTLLKEYCVDMDVKYDDLEVEDCHTNEHISGCLSTLKKSVKNIYEELDATHVVFFLGGTGNFRLDLPLPTQYKSGRKDMRKPDYLKDCRAFLNKHYDCFIVKGHEADDICESLSAYVINETPAWGCAVSMDKDIHSCLVPNRYYHLVNKDIVELSGGLGSLGMQGNKLVGQGLKFLVSQIMLFDRADGYIMNNHYFKRFGQKSFYKEFKDYNTEKSFLEAVLSKLEELLPEKTNYVDWEGASRSYTRLELLEVYFSCAYMKKCSEDNTTFKSILNKYGVDYE